MQLIKKLWQRWQAKRAWQRRIDDPDDIMYIDDEPMGSWPGEK